MEKIDLQINDFRLFYETIQNITKVTANLKIIVTKNGFTSSLADDNETIRLDVDSTAVSIPQSSDVEEINICTKSMHTISQLLGKIYKSHTSKSKKDLDFSDVYISVDDTTIYIKSSSLKTSVFLDNESAVHVLNPFLHELHTIAEVNTSIDDIKEVISSTFIFKQSEKIIVEVCHQDDMVKNIAYAFMSDPLDPRTNDMVVKFGNIVAGDFTRKILIDIPKIKYLSVFPVEAMTIKFNQEPCFCSEFTTHGAESGCYSSYRVMGKYVLPRKLVEVNAD